MKNPQEEIIYRALRGQATQEEEAMIAKWYEDSPEECRKEIEAIHAIIDLAGLSVMTNDMLAAHGDRTGRKEASGNPDSQGNRTGRTEGHMHGRTGNHRLAWMAAVSSAAAIAFAVVTGYMSHKYTFDSISSQMTAVEAPPGEHFIITLPDNSSVHLNSGARIEYPVVFKKDKREVFLTGEAMFDVVHDDKKPFIVKTFTSEVSVLGTKFDVEAYKESSIFSTTLFEGRVKVVNLSDPERKGVILNPNDVIRIENGVMKMEKIRDQDDICWTRGLIKIGGKTFDRMMADFEKAFGVTIDIQRRQLPDISEVSGKIRVNDGVANALRILQRTADFRFRIDEATNTITIY